MTVKDAKCKNGASCKIRILPTNGFVGTVGDVIAKWSFEGVNKDTLHPELDIEITKELIEYVEDERVKEQRFKDSPSISKIFNKD
jgi:hypothetical protein